MIDGTPKKASTVMVTPVTPNFWQHFSHRFRRKNIYSLNNPYMRHLQLYFWYIDDVFIVRQESSREINTFVGYLNQNTMNIVLEDRKLNFWMYKI